MKHNFKSFLFIIFSLVIFSCNNDVTMGIVSDVKASLTSGDYSEVKEISLSCETEEAQIFYTLDGAEPGTSAKVYSTPFKLDATNKSIKIKAIAIKADLNPSPIVSFDYTFTPLVVTYDSLGGSKVTSVATSLGAKLVAPSNPVKTGYGFDGWYKDKDLKTPWDFSKDTVSSSTTLYAKWKLGSYTITYVLNNGTNAANNPSNYSIESENITLLNPTKAGYSFDGWYGKEDFSDTKLTSITKGSTGDKKLYAKFSIITYTITYNLNNGTNGLNPSTYSIETATITLLNPTKTNYTFNGWFTKSDYSDSAVTTITKGSIENKVFYAKWSPNQSVSVELPQTQDLSPTISGETTVAVTGRIKLSINGTWTSIKWHRVDGNVFNTNQTIDIDTDGFIVGNNLIYVVVTNDKGNTYTSSVTLVITK